MHTPEIAEAAHAQGAAPEPASKQQLVRRGRNPEVEAALGASIRAARIAAKMSQAGLGAAVGISFQQVQKYEKGADRVAASTLQSIAAALGIHPGSFFNGEVSAPTGSTPDVRSAMRIAERVQGIRDPGVLKRLLALVDLLAEANGDADHEPVGDGSAGAT